MILFPEKLWYEAQQSRHKDWWKHREGHLLQYPKCACCGDDNNVAVHHIKPFHLFPELELEPANLITLCEGGPINCHFIVGHGGKNWRTYIPEDKLQLAILAMQQGIKFLQGMTSD